MKRSRRRRWSVLVGAVSAMMPAAAQATTYFWTGAGPNDNWSTPSNWMGGVPVASFSTDIVFVGSGQPNPNLDMLMAVRSLSFNAGPFSLGPSSMSIDIGSGGITNNTSSTQTVRHGIYLNANQTWSSAVGRLNHEGFLWMSGRTLTLSASQPMLLQSNLQSIGDIVKQGPGPATLMAPASSTHSGLIMVLEGTLAIGATAAGNNVTQGLIQVGDFTGSDLLRNVTSNALWDGLSSSTPASVMLNPGATWDLNGYSDTVQSLQLTDTSMNIGTGTLTLKVHPDFPTGIVSGHYEGATNVISGTGKLALLAGATTFSVYDGPNAIDLDITAQLHAAEFGGTQLVKDAPGALRLGTDFSGDGNPSPPRSVRLVAGSLLLATNGGLGTGDFTFSGGILSPSASSRSFTNNVNLNGAGTVNTAGLNVTFSGTLGGSGSLTKTGAGTLGVKHVRAAGLSVSAGTVRVSDSGGLSGGTSKVNTASVTTAAGAKLDLRDNKLIVTTGGPGSWNGSAYTGLTGLVQSGRGDGSWNGSGIVTSMSDATTGVLTTLAVATAAEVEYAGGTFGGLSVGTNDVLVMYTWGGDADLNGELNGDDYFWIDSHVLQSGSVFGFHNGDFDYNGEINGDDYFILDSNILQAQASPAFPTGSGAGAGLSAIPEPSGFGLGAAAVLGSLSRKRRR